MKLGVLAVLFGNKTLADACAHLKNLGVETVEIGCGGFPGKAHCDPAKLLADESALQEFVDTVKNSGLEISALACHGNMVHPNKEIADGYKVTHGDLKIYFNILADGRVMHRNCFNTFDGITTDAMMLAVSGNEYFVVNGSSVRKNGKSILDVFARITDKIN